jgi:hypothetical protein
VWLKWILGVTKHHRMGGIGQFRKLEPFVFQKNIDPDGSNGVKVA